MREETIGDCRMILGEQLAKALDRIEELEAEADRVVMVFDSECWAIVKRLLKDTGFDWKYADNEVTADEAYEYVKAELERLNAALGRSRNLIECLVENDPNEAITDAGHTVLDKWRYDAKDFLASLHSKEDADGKG